MKNFDKFLLFFDNRIKPIILWVGISLLLCSVVYFTILLVPEIWGYMVRSWEKIKNEWVEWLIILIGGPIVLVGWHIFETWYTERVGRIRREQSENNKAKSEAK